MSGSPWSWPGEVLKSELRYISVSENTASDSAYFDIKVSYLRPLEQDTIEKIGIGVTVLFYRPGDDEMIKGGVTQAYGDFSDALQSGIYDIKFSYVGCNSLLLRNVDLKAESTNKIIVRLGMHGGEEKTYETDLQEKR